MSFFLNIVEKSIHRVLERSYFPEIWYVVENWLAAQKYKHVLDVGSGSGFIALALAKTGWDVTCLDDSVPSLVKTRKRFATAEYEARFEQSKVEKLPFDEKVFDVVTSINMIEFSSNPQKMMNEIFRVLRPGGIALVVTFKKGHIWSHPLIARKVRRDEGFREVKCLSKSELQKLFVSSGFALKRQKEVARFLPFEFRGRKVRWPFSGAIAMLMQKPKAVKQESSDPDVTVVRSLS